MPKPATLNATVALIRQSRLVPENQLSDFLSGVKPQQLQTLTPHRLLEELVDADILTEFQAEQISIGRSQGFVLGNYRILNLLGKGGMGQIYLAEHLNYRNRVALKVLRPRAMASPVSLQRFLREATAAALISHPNVVRIFDVHTNEDPPFMVMEFVDGVSLQASVASLGVFSAAEACFCVRQVALGLQAIFEAGLVHRDIKPANLLINRDGQAKILDFGIVRMTDEEVHTLSEADTIVGTLDYISPEQVASAQVDIRADLYSLGATFYFLLTGKTPYCGESARHKVLRILHEEPTPLRHHRPDVPNSLAALVHRLLAKDPSQRFESPIQVADAIGEVVCPRGFPRRLFEQTIATESECGNPTDIGTRAVLDDSSHSHLPCQPPQLEDSQSGTVEFAKDPTVLPFAPCELTMRTQLDDALDEAAQKQSMTAVNSTRSVRLSREGVLRLFGWSLVAVVVLVAGVGSLLKLLTTP